MRKLIRCLAALSLLTGTVLVSGTATANAEDNGVGQTPALGWSSWSFVRHNPTAQTIDAQADAMASSGLAAVGFQYVNVDDFWYQCPGSQGPNVDQFGRWVTDSAKFPSNGTEDGIAAVADHVHADGLKFGLQKRQRLDRFRGTEHLGLFGGHGAGAANCDPASFTAVLRAPPGILEGLRGSVLIDLVEPGVAPAAHHRDLPGRRIVREETYRDCSPWVVVAIAADVS